MLRTTKNMKDKYENIQNYIFSLIPEKWEEIYLYTSIEGEIFFYYIPKGILKRKAINVYEVPTRFNINEEQYLNIVEELCKCIKSLKDDFQDTEQEVWSSLTISIANCKFKVEYSYEELPRTEREIYIRNVIWKYNYLKIGGKNKEERKILDDYFLASKPIKKETYETGLYIKTDKNIIEFGKEDIADREFVIYEKEDLLNITNSIKNKFKNREEKSNQSIKEVEPQNEKEEKKTRNQILDS